MIKASNSGTALRKIFTQLSSDFEVMQANGESIVVSTSIDGSMRSLKDILDDTRDAFNGMSQAEKEALQNDLTGTANNLGIALSKENGVLKTQAELYDEVMQAAQTMTDAGRVAEAEALAGKTAMAGLLAVVGASDEDYSKLADAVYNADGAAAKMAAIMMDNLEGDFVLFQSAAEGVKIAFMEKLSPYLRSFVKWITGKMPDVSKVMEKVADKIGDAISNIQEKIQDFTSSDAWGNMDFFGKISIAWNELIMQPFSDWWSGTGKTWFAQKAGEIGNAIGKGITFGLMALLGIQPQSAIEDGVSIGASFAEGFAKGFDIKKVIGAILEGIKNIGKDAATLLPGGEKASSTAWLSTGLLAYGGMKVGKGIAGVGNLIKGASAVTTGTSLLGSAGAGTGLLGLGSNTAIALGAGNMAGGASLSVGALSAVGLSSVAGGILAATGLADAMKDFKEGKNARGVAKTGMVGGGAAIGATIGTFLLPGIGTVAGGLIGSGIGGIAALLKGDTVGDWFHETFTKKGKEEKIKREIEEQEAIKQAQKEAEREEAIRKEKEKQLAIEKQIYDLKNTKLEIQNTKDQIRVTNQLKDAWDGINKEMESGLLTEEEKIKKQEELKVIVSELAEIYPEFIDNTDLENGKLDEKLEKIQNMNELERERKSLDLENRLIDAEKNLEYILDDFNKSNENLDRLWERKQLLKDNRIDLENDVSELGVLEQKLIGAKKKGEDPSVIQRYENQTQNQKREMDKNLQDIGIEISYNHTFEMVPMEQEFSKEDIHSFSYTKESLGSMLDEEQKRNNSELDLEIQNNQRLTDQMQEIYDAGIQLMELELKMPIDEAAESYETLGETQKKVFDKMLDDLFILNSKFQDFIDQPKYIDILVKFTPEKAELLEKNKKLTTDNSINNSEDDIVNPTPYAMGGILTRPHIGMVAEAGAEAIIPLTGTNKQRGKKLWEQAGRILGMFPNEKIYAHAQGGIFGDVSESRKLQSPIYDPFFTNEEETESQQISSIISAPIDIGGIHLGGINFTFDGTGNGDRESIMRTIREQMPEIANEVAEEIAKVLQKTFANMKSSIA